MCLVWPQCQHLWQCDRDLCLWWVIGIDSHSECAFACSFVPWTRTTSWWTVSMLMSVQGNNGQRDKQTMHKRSEWMWNPQHNPNTHKMPTTKNDLQTAQQTQCHSHQTVLKLQVQWQSKHHTNHRAVDTLPLAQNRAKHCNARDPNTLPPKLQSTRCIHSVWELNRASTALSQHHGHQEHTRY